ncbi:DUF6531 domain-containing protein [Streptomyces tibetensis]|uniref:DUF6531 domain-containing protein n=1 Tax=Streptomyces tibetensis TaxID=2382123 RepID=A0ABW6MUI2_9ACTN
MVDLNPLHYVNKFNHMFGDNLASGLEFLGITDPAVDPDGVREIAKKWRHLATALDDASEAARKALSDVEWEGQAAKAFHKRAKASRKQATDMADALREGAKALDEFADQAHELLTEMGVLVAEIAEFEIAGLALSVLTGGASAVVSSLMAGERALKVVALVARIEREGTALASAIRGVMEVIRAVERALKTLKEIRGVAAAGRMAKEGAKFAAFDTLLKDPAAFKDPEKLTGILTEGALLGIGFGALGKALGKGLKALKPADLAKLSKGLKLNCASFERMKLNPGFNKLPASIQNMVKKFVRDPIDVATGDMALPRVDVELPGALPLVLERTHISSYRSGGWFGPSWASTLDQRVQADHEGLVYAAADGARICFPFPDPETNEPVPPETPGSRLTLSWDEETDGAVCVTDPDTGLIRVFHSPVPAADDTAVDLPLQHIQDRNGNRISVVYTQGDVPGEVVHSGGYRIALDHDRALSRITGLRLVDVQGGSSTTLLTFRYDEAGRLTEEINSSGLPLRYTYDADGRITSWCDRNGTTYWYSYDDRGRVVATGGTGDALASTLTYDDATRTTHVTDSLGHTRVYEHNEAFRLIRETDPLGLVTEQEWDEHLQLRSVTDPLGQQTRYQYDDHGRMTCATRPDGARSTAEFGAAGLPSLVVDPDGLRWFQEYDEAGNLVAVTDPAGHTTRYGYDKAGGLASVTDALGCKTRIRNDRAGLPVEVTDPLGAVTTYLRDSFGRPVLLTDPLGAQTRMEWTVDGRPARRTSADGSEESWLYDGEGNCIAHRDANGAVSRLEYTYFDITSARIGADGVRYEFTHDSELRLLQVLNPQGLTWDYEYDAAGRLVAESDFDGRVQQYRYDTAGQLAEQTTPLGEVIRYERNTLGQVLRKDAAGRVTDYTYDLAGRLIHAVGPDAVLNVRRDATGQVLSEAVNGRELAYTYDALGRTVARTTPSGAVSTWTYDEVGNRTELTTCGRTLTFTRDASGREIGRRMGMHTRLLHDFDALGRLRSQTVIGAGGSTLQRRAYTFRADGHVTGVEDQLNGPRRYILDPIGRVTGVQADQWTESYAYDTAGNQSQATWPEQQSAQETRGPREFIGTRITRAGSVRYEHDAAGRLILSRQTRLSRKADIWRFEWDVENHLTAVTTPDGSEWRYKYDPLGRRIAKTRMTAPGSEIVAEQTDFAWDGATLCEETSWTSGSSHVVSLTWDHDDLHPVSQAERITTTEAPQQEIDERFFSIVTDIVGAPAELVDEYGRIAWRARTTIWGATAWAADSDAYTPLRFPGQYYDRETGHHYNCFRHYVPDTARYTTPDPLGLAPADNSYAYVENPLTWIDPLGLSACPRTANAAQLQDFYSQAQKYGKGGYKELADGRFRFYGEVTPARNPGEMIGRRLVREWDPATGAKRIWHETLDANGKVRIVRPDVSVTGGKKIHYQFDKNGNFTGTF